MKQNQSLKKRASNHELFKYTQLTFMLFIHYVDLRKSIKHENEGVSKQRTYHQLNEWEGNKHTFSFFP
jgi:hypothetical protein